jgi:redox-sensitive bicupin YhaK (pirin superfamily)
LTLPEGRLAYVHVARGSLTVNGEALQAGDAAKLSQIDTVKLEKGHNAEVLLFDLGRLQG